MYTTQSGSYQNIDPSVQRILADTITMVNDVDQRLTTLRQGIAHAFPQLAPIALARPGLNSPLGGMPGSIGALGGSFPPTQGIGVPFPTHGLQGVPFGAVPQQGFPSLFGLPGGGLQSIPSLPQGVSPYGAAPFPLAGIGLQTPSGFGAGVPQGLFSQLNAGAAQGAPAMPLQTQGSQTPWNSTTGPNFSGVVAPTFRGY